MAYSVNLSPMLRKAWHVTQQKMGSRTLVLITHFTAEILLMAFLNQWCEMAFLNQGCERLSLGFECHLTTDVAECIQ